MGLWMKRFYNSCIWDPEVRIRRTRASPKRDERAIITRESMIPNSGSKVGMRSRLGSLAALIL